MWQRWIVIHREQWKGEWQRWIVIHREQWKGGWQQALNCSEFLLRACSSTSKGILLLLDHTRRTSYGQSSGGL